MRQKAAWLLVAVLCIPAATFGLGLGKLHTSSGLNEPFRGRIALVGADPDTADAIKVTLASPEQFERAGVARPHLLTKLRFDVVSTGDGAYIDVSTADPVREPFLNFLLEVNWPQGRLVREYTTLLDPPLYDPGAPRAARAVETPVAAPARVAVPSAPRPAPAAAPAAGIGERYVTSGDTLWAIASEVQPDGSVSVQQVMLALLRANPHAFAENNVNTLRAGYVLQIPDRSAMTVVDPAEAIAEVRRQHALWEEYRLTRAARPAPRPEGGTGAGAGAGAPVTPEPAENARLELVAPDDGRQATPGAAAAAAAESDLQALRRELALATEQLAAQEQEGSELRTRLGEAEELVQQLQRLVELREQELAALQQQLGQTPPSGLVEQEPPAAEPQQDPVAAAEPAAGEPLVAGEPPAAPEPTLDVTGEPAPVAVEEFAPPPQTGMVARVEDAIAAVVPRWALDLLPGGALTVLAIVLVVILLPVIALVAWWRSGAREQQAPVVTAAAAPAAAGAAAGAAPEESTISEAMAKETVVGLEVEPDEVHADTAPAAEQEPAEDPLAEVNVYLAYERFEQAEQLVRDAIARDPENAAYHLRLLEVYYSANDKAAYETAARGLQELTGGSGPMWDSAVAMWKEMSPERELFAAGAESAPAGPADTGGAREFLDITGAVPATAAAEAGMATVTIRPGEIQAPPAPDDSGDSDADAGLDFDIGGPGADQEAGADEHGVFDLTAGGDTGIETSGEEDMLDLTTPGAGEPVSYEQSGFLDVTQGEAEGTGEQDTQEFETLELDITGTADQAPQAGEDSELLDITGGDETAGEQAGGDLDLDLTGAGPGGGPGALLDITAGEPEGDEAPGDLAFDVTGGPGDTRPEADLLDVTGGGEDLLEVTGAGEDLLDVTVTGDTASIDQGELLNVTAPGTLGVTTVGAEQEDEGLFDLTAGEGTAGELAGVEFDLTGADSESSTTDLGSDAAELQGAGESAGVEFDLTGADSESPSTDLEREMDAGRGGEVLDFGVDSLTMEADTAASGAEERLGDEGGGSALAGEPLEIDLADAELPMDSEFGGDEGGGGLEGFDLELETDRETESAGPSGADTVAGLSVSVEDDDEGDAFSLDLEADTAGGSGLESGIDFELDAGAESDGESLDTLELDRGDADTDAVGQTVVLPGREDAEEQSEEDEADTKLNLAKAYIELGDADGARAILDEVSAEGTPEQQAEAQRLRDQT